MNRVVIRRGDIYYADLRPVIGSEQGGVRPVLVIQNDIGNKHSPTVICAAESNAKVFVTGYDACGIKHAPLCDGEGFGHFTGTTPHDR